MSLKDALENRPRNSARPCVWAELVASLPEDEAEAATMMMDGPDRWDIAPLLEALRDEGYACGDNAAYRHRRRDCQCH